MKIVHHSSARINLHRKRRTKGRVSEALSADSEKRAVAAQETVKTNAFVRAGVVCRREVCARVCVCVTGRARDNVVLWLFRARRFLVVGIVALRAQLFPSATAS